MAPRVVVGMVETRPKSSRRWLGIIGHHSVVRIEGPIIRLCNDLQSRHVRPSRFAYEAGSRTATGNAVPLGNLEFHEPSSGVRHGFDSDPSRSTSLELVAHRGTAIRVGTEDPHLR